jgi:hypothetical protein
MKTKSIILLVVMSVMLSAFLKCTELAFKKGH